MQNAHKCRHLSPLFQVILQPELQLSHHHLTLPLGYGVAGLIVSGHQGVYICQYHVDDRHLLQLLLCVELLSTHRRCIVRVDVKWQVWEWTNSPFGL